MIASLSVHTDQRTKQTKVTENKNKIETFWYLPPSSGHDNVSRTRIYYSATSLDKYVVELTPFCFLEIESVSVMLPGAVNLELLWGYELQTVLYKNI